MRVFERLVVGEHRDPKLIDVAPHGDIYRCPGECTPVG